MVMARAFDEVREFQRSLVGGLVLGPGAAGEFAGIEVLAELLFREEGGHGDVREHHDAFFADEDRAGGGELFAGGHARQREVGQATAVIPGDLDGLALGVFGAGEGPFDGLFAAPGLRIGADAVRFDVEGVAELERGEDGVEQVAAEVAHGAASEVDPVAPLEGVIHIRRKLARGRAAEPEVPIDAGGHGGRGGRGGHAGILVTGVRMPGMHGEDLADTAGLDELHAGAVFLGGVDLIAHLGADLRLGGLQAELPGFPDGMCERLLAIDVLAEAHGGHGGQGMHVVRRRDGDGIKAVAELGEHLPPVGEVRDPRVTFVDLGEASGVDIAQADEAGLGVRGALIDVGVAFAIHPDRGDLDLRVKVAGADDGREGERGQRSGAQEITTRQGHGGVGYGH